jgi:hypothetical protein
LIKPNPHFKILFGCGYRMKFDTTRAPRSVYVPRLSRSGSQRHSKTEPTFSPRAAESFRRGIEDGTLLRLKRLPAISQEENPYISIAELEVELESVYSSYSLTEKVLNSAEDDVSPYKFPPLVEALRSTMCLSSSHSSVTTDNDEHASTLSTNTSISEDPYKRHPLSEKLRIERLGTQTQFSLWFGQSICEEPQPWIPRMVQQPERSVFGFTQCKTLDSRRQLALEEAKAVAERESEGYWIWDEAVKNYKHYDEGCAEPVWYNPP